MPGEESFVTRPVIAYRTSAPVPLRSYDWRQTLEDIEMARWSPTGQHSNLSTKPDRRGAVWKALKSAKLLILFVVVGLAVGGLGVFVGLKSHGSGFGSNFANSMLALSSGLILGGGVKLLLDSFQESQKKRHEQRELRERLLNDLRDVYLRTEHARLMVRAHKSAETYAQQMSELIGCQAVLLRVKRSLDLGLDEKDSKRNEQWFADIVGYLRALQNEFANNYNNIAVSQNAWDLMSQQAKLPVLHDLTKCGERFNGRLVGPLNALVASLLEKDIPTLAKGVGKRAKGIPELDKDFDGLVEKTAEKIQSICAEAVREPEARPDQEVNGHPDAAGFGTQRN
jgi:hypothetical protein